MRRVLIGILFLAAIGISAGAVWIMILTTRHDTSTADIIAALRAQWAIVAGCGAVIGVVAVVLQRMRPPTEEWDWTFTGSLGFGACLYALVIRPWFPHSALEGLPGPFPVLTPIALSVGVAYVALRPLMKRRPAEPASATDRGK